MPQRWGMAERRSRAMLIVALTFALASAQPGAGPAAAASRGGGEGWDPHRGMLISGATVVTMDDGHAVVPHGRVLIRDGVIVAVWSGVEPPPGVVVGGASRVEATPSDLLFPGLINLHDHPREDILEAWLPPASDARPDLGKTGRDPYANRYQWNGATGIRPTLEYRRLVDNPAGILSEPVGLGLGGEVVKYAEVAALLAGETAIQGAPRNPESDHVLARNVDNDAFNTRIAAPLVRPITTFPGPALERLRSAMVGGRVDAWMVHLAEGVRDAARRPKDGVSSRAEFDILRADGLLTDMTVVIHGTALERTDFAAMRAAGTNRNRGGDGRGAKLVWSPLSNLLLYGTTTHVYDALAEDVLVSLGTDWTPSGSRSLLRELKVADASLRDPRLLGHERESVPLFAIAGKTEADRRDSEAALDQALVDMVTRNPARTLRWNDRVGSIEAGRVADLVLVRRPTAAPPVGIPLTVYRSLIQSTEAEVELVLVGGDPLVGDVDRMALLKPGDFEVLTSATDGFTKAVDVTTSLPVPEGDETLAELTDELRLGLAALGGDEPPAGGGPGPADNTYDYLQARVSGGAAAFLTRSAFRAALADSVGTLPNGSLNLERIDLVPLLAADDDFLEHLLHADVDPVTGLLADPTPPYALYPAVLNHVGPAGNPLENLP